MDDGEVPDGGVRGGGEASDELPRLLLHRRRHRSAAARPPEKGMVVFARWWATGLGDVGSLVGWYPDG